MSERQVDHETVAYLDRRYNNVFKKLLNFLLFERFYFKKVLIQMLPTV